MTSQSNQEIIVYIGTYTRSTSQGIYVYSLNPYTGRLTFRSLASGEGARDPSFLALSPSGKHLYAVNEIDDFGGKESGAISAFAINQDTGELSFINQQPTIGTWPCHVVVEQTGKYAIAANYLSGSVAMLPINEDGSMGEPSHFIQHEGSSVNPDRQQGPHAHSTTLSPDNRFAYVADLGMDKIMIYRIDLNEGKLIPNDPPFVSVRPGGGPRHFGFHPNGKRAYLINEIGNTITVFDFDGEKGTLSEIETVPTLPLNFDGRNTTADIHVHPSGKFLYGSNRGHHSLVINAIDEATGELTYVGHQSTQGETPRHFAIEPSGRYLFACNQNSDSIVTFRIDESSGKLTPTGQVNNVPMPVCMKFLSL